MDGRGGGGGGGGAEERKGGKLSVRVRACVGAQGGSQDTGRRVGFLGGFRRATTDQYSVREEAIAGAVAVTGTGKSHLKKSAASERVGTDSGGRREAGGGSDRGGEWAGARQSWE